MCIKRVDGVIRELISPPRVKSVNFFRILGDFCVKRQENLGDFIKKIQEIFGLKNFFLKITIWQNLMSRKLIKNRKTCLVKWDKKQPKIPKFAFSCQSQLRKMKLMSQPTGNTLENHLQEGFQFTVISSNKNQKIQWLIVTPQFGVMFSRYQGKVGPVADHNPTTK